MKPSSLSFDSANSQTMTDSTKLQRYYLQGSNKGDFAVAASLEEPRMQLENHVTSKVAIGAKRTSMIVGVKAITAEPFKTSNNQCINSQLRVWSIRLGAKQIEVMLSFGEKSRSIMKARRTIYYHYLSNQKIGFEVDELEGVIVG